jgi:Flp pilus assembly protein TadD
MTPKREVTMLRTTRMFLTIACLAVAGPALAAADDPAERHVDYGVSLALAGKTGAAESVFVALLSGSTKDARALNNLGNLSVLRGDLDVALAFYDRAVKGDSLDGGIRLNRATVYMMRGESDQASTEAAAGIRLAGGEAKAASLLGLKPASSDAARAAQASAVNKDEVRALLAAAAAHVPHDTTHAVTGSAAGTAPKKSTTWRSAGPRGAGDSDAAAVLYWKR